MSEADSGSQSEIYTLILNKIDEAINDIDQVPSTKSLEEKEVLCCAVMQRVFKIAMNGSYPCLKIIDKFKYSKDEAEDDQLFKEFLSFNQNEKNIVIKTMQLACNAGIKMETKDLSIRQKWLEKLMSVSC